MPAAPHVADLTVGDTIHPDQPPHCCHTPMRYYGVGDLSLWECGTCGRQVHADACGVVTGLPT